MNLNALYDYLCREATTLVTNTDPCEISKGKCKGRLKICCTENLLCDNLTTTGCQVTSLSCKLWLCKEMRKKYPVLANQLNQLSDIAFKHKIYQCRYSKQETFEIDIFYNLPCEEK